MSRAGLRRELGLASLLAVVFFNVSGGPYGVEDAIASFGPGLTLVLLVLTPLIWSLPVSLAMAELAAALPEEGGYVAWVRRAFGPFWGFQVGWWSWINSFVDVAVYPALFADYAQYWWPEMSGGRTLGGGADLRVGAHRSQSRRRAGDGAQRGGARRRRADPGGGVHRDGRAPRRARAVETLRGGRRQPRRGHRIRAGRDDVELLRLGQSEHAPRRERRRRAPAIAAPCCWRCR